MGAEGGELPSSLAEIAVIEYSNPVRRPVTEHVPLTLRFVGAAKQVKVFIVAGSSESGPTTVAAYWVTIDPPWLLVMLIFNSPRRGITETVGATLGIDIGMAPAFCKKALSALTRL